MTRPFERYHRQYSEPAHAHTIKMAPTANGTQMSPNGNATAGATKASDEQLQSFWSRYEHLKMNDVMKNVLVEVRRTSILPPAEALRDADLKYRRSSAATST